MYKLIFFLILVYLFFRIFTRFLLPWLLKYYIKRTMKNNFGTDWNDMQNSRHKDKPQINIKPNRKTPFKPGDDDGEYVDYTEIK